MATTVSNIEDGFAMKRRREKTRMRGSKRKVLKEDEKTLELLEAEERFKQVSAAYSVLEHQHGK